VLCGLSWKLHDAIRLIETKRPVVDFADVYVKSIENYLKQAKLQWPGQTRVRWQVEE